jgi:L-lysine 2,3-aminomutase
LRWRPLIVLHTNHGNEIDVQVAACGLLRSREQVVEPVGAAGRNQRLGAAWRTVHRLWMPALPYYLHLLDRVRVRHTSK